MRERADAAGTGAEAEQVKTRGLAQRVAAWPWKKITLASLGLGALAALGGVLTTVLVIRHYSQDLPDVQKLESEYAPPQVTRVQARDGTLLANIFSERRTVVPFERVPDHVKSAFLAAEDSGFYQHEGLDYLGLVRAMVVNLRAGHVKQGGSTITQQVVKNVLLDHRRSYERKIRETILAYRIETYLTKEQILGMYMNHIYLGHGRYGVEEAARFYFGKHVEELNVGEAALIAGVVASPERYSPRKSEEKALIRRRYVLGQMLAKGFATQEVHDAYVEAPLRLAPHAEAESDIAPEMLGHARRLLKKMQPEAWRKGGYTVKTTIDPALQVAARAALRSGLDGYLSRQKLKAPFTLKKRRLWGSLFEGMPRRHGIYVGKVIARDDEASTIDVQVGELVGRVYLAKDDRYNPKHLSPTKFVGDEASLRVRVLDDPASGTPEDPVRLRLELGPQGALVALDVRSREVLAAVGSYEAVAGGLDRSVQARRQPGSTFKPIFYSYGLSTGEITPASRFEFPLSEKQRKKLEQAGAEDIPETEAMLLRQGVARSDNRVALDVFRQVGARQVVDWAQTLGIVSRLGADESLALGSYEVAPVEMASAYAVLASGGLAASPRFFLSLESGGGQLELPATPPPRQVMEPNVAYVMTSILQSVIAEGTAKRAAKIGFPVAGKTGTTNRAKDCWFVGYSPEIVVAVWVGFDDAHPLGWGESGAAAALPIWTEFMKAAHQGKPSLDFPRPPGVSDRQIDPATGLLARYGQEDARAEIFISGSEPTETAPEPLEAGLGGASGDSAELDADPRPDPTLDLPAPQRPGDSIDEPESGEDKPLPDAQQPGFAPAGMDDTEEEIPPF